MENGSAREMKRIMPAHLFKKAYRTYRENLLLNA